MWENYVTSKFNLIDTKTLGLTTINDQTDKSPEVFVEYLKAGKKLHLLFNNKWTLVYHEDNRCDGSTDGRKDGLSSEQIDLVIRLKVENAGDGWSCDKEDPTTFDMDFDLKKRIMSWDRVELADYGASVIYIVGAGESDYLKLHYNDEGLIVKLEYRSEDPG